jgi:hypothetical protein
MKTTHTMDAQLLGELARFLDDHPGFSPTYTPSSDDAILCGFHVGDCAVTMDEIQQFLHLPDESQPSALLAYAEWPGGL